MKNFKQLIKLTDVVRYIEKLSKRNRAQLIAELLPKDVVYFCAIRVMANATTGKYSKQIVPNLKAMTALERWPKK